MSCAEGPERAMTDADASSERAVTLFLDVDGVLSPCPASSGAWRDWRRIECGFHCYLSQQMADALAAIDAERVWLTTWEGLANDVLCPALGWDILKVVDRKQHAEEPWWKLNAITAHIEAGGGPFIWVDDDIAYEDHVKPSVDGCPVPYLLISPDTAVGITKKHIKAMTEFVASTGGSNGTS